MAKNKKQEKKINKNKKGTTTKNNTKDFNFPNGELYLRMNYLFRLAENVYKSRDANNENNFQKNNNLMSRIYIAIMKDISKRNVLHTNSKNKFIYSVHIQLKILINLIKK